MDKEEALSPETEAQDVFQDDKIQQLEVSEDNISKSPDPFIDDLLTGNDLYELSSREATTIIYVLGDIGSGKTTLETVIYGLFCEKIHEEWLFAGSKTINAYERRRQYISAKSGKTGVDMPRTSAHESPRVFLHMELFHRLLACRKNVLFTDISGEVYQACAKKCDMIEAKLPLIDYADHILLLLDAKKLIRKEEQGGVVLRAVSFLRMLKASKLYSKHMKIDVVVSKCDEIVKSDDGDKEYPYRIESEFVAVADAFDLKYHWIEAQNTEQREDYEHTTDVMDFLKYLLKNSHDDEIHVDRGAIKAELSDECNLLRGKWANG